MQSDIFTAKQIGVEPGAGYGESNTIALQEAVDAACTAGGATIFIPAGVYEFTGSITIEVNTAANADGTVRIVGESLPTFAHEDSSNSFFLMTADGRGSVGQVVLEGLQFQGGSKTRAGEKAA